MKIVSYNDNRYINVINGATNFWWDTISNAIVAKKTIQSMVLRNDKITLGCATVCEGPEIVCCPDSLLANNYDCLFDNNYDCLSHN